MEQTSKELLLKDLCARLPYGVEIICESSKINLTLTPHMLEGIFKDNNKLEWKPYLFPLSSMTEKQKEETSEMFWDFDNNEFTNNTEFVDHYDCFSLIDWLNKNHFDYRGLIEKGLAIDATDKNIY